MPARWSTAVIGERHGCRGLVLFLGLLVGAGFQAAPAHAYTECSGNVQMIWAGDGGTIWIHLQNGGAAIVSNTDPNREAVIALGTTALVTSRQVTIRYAANGVNCSQSGRTDFTGMYLH